LSGHTEAWEHHHGRFDRRKMSIPQGILIYETEEAEHQIDIVSLVGLLHDVGKIGSGRN